MGAASPGPNVELTHRRRRGLLAIMLGLVAVLLIVIAFAGLAMVGVRTDLQRGQHALQDARRALVNGSLPEAAASFDGAGDAFADAARRSHALPARIGSWLPFLGNNVDVGAGLAEAGIELAAAGDVLSGALSTLPDGLGSLAPQDGRIPVDDIGALSAPVAEASSRAAAAIAAVESTPGSFLVSPVAEARWEALDEIGDAARALEAADVLLAELPRFAGVDEARRYLVASENPAELRGTGGLWGAYAVLTLDGGDPSFSRVRPIQALPDVEPEEVPPPSQDYERNYGEFGGAGSWQNLNMTPDFPTAARAALGAFEAATGERLDGVIAADPFALELMLGVTGPMLLPGTDLRLSADNVVAITANEAYTLFEGSVERKKVLGSVSIDVLERFLAMEGKGIARIRALLMGASGGHLKVYTVDEAFERGLGIANADGAHILPGSGDLLSVHLNDSTATKVDFFATRLVDHVVRLGGNGEAISTTTLTLGNDVPPNGQPRYVVGPIVDELSAGDQRSFVKLSCHDPCTLVEARADGGPIGLVEGRELGVPWFRDFPTIPAGDDREMEITTRTSGVWEGNGSGGVYRLTVLGQTTIEPTELSVRIEPPAGTEIVWTNEEMTLTDGAAIWEGEAPASLELEVRFRAPLPLRWWRNVVRPFGGL